MLALQDNKYAQVARCIQEGAIIFLGTPHRGSDSAAKLHAVLAATVGSKAFLEELKTQSGLLTAINEDFRHCAKHLTLWSFYETMPTPIPLGRRIVSEPFVYPYTKYTGQHSAKANHFVQDDCRTRLSRAGIRKRGFLAHRRRSSLHL